MTLRTTLGLVRGLGSAKNGTREGITQRLAAVVLLPMVLWLVISLVAHVGSSYEHMRAWLASPCTTALLLCLIFAIFVHVQLGLKMVIEDYVHGPVANYVLTLVVKLASVLLGVFSAVAVLRIAFAGV